MKTLVATVILGIIFFGFTTSSNAQTANSEIRRGDALLSNPANKAYARFAYTEAMRIAAQNNDWVSMLTLANRFLLIGEEWAARQSFSLAFTYSYDMAIGDPNKTGIRRDCASGRRGLMTVISFFDDTLSEIGKSANTQNLMTFDRNQSANAVNWLNQHYGNSCPGMDNFGIRTSKTAYSPTENVFVSYSGMRGQNNDVVTIVDSSSNAIVSWFYTSGNTQGSIRFPVLPAGNYEAHLRPFGGQIEALSRFTVRQGSSASSTTSAARISVSTTKSGYSQLVADKNIGVSYAGIPDRSKYWIGIFKKGDLSKHIDYAWPESASGGVNFPMLSDGAYEVHVIDKDSRQSVASSSFTVGIRQTSAGVCRSLTQC